MNVKSLSQNLYDSIIALLPEGWELYGEPDALGGLSVDIVDLEFVTNQLDLPVEIVKAIEAIQPIDSAPESGLVFSSDGEMLGAVGEVDFDQGETYAIVTGRMYTHPERQNDDDRRLRIDHKDFPSMGKTMQGRLNGAGFVFVDDLIAISAEELDAAIVPGLGRAKAEKFQAQAREILDNN